MVPKEVKLKIIEALRKQEEIHGTRIKVCSKYEISPSVLTRMLNDYETENILSEARWINLARIFDIALDNEVHIVTAKTATFNYIWQQLEFAQEYSVSGILCDRADIGKTHTAKVYAREHKNVVYLDCGMLKTVQRFVRSLAKGFGLDDRGNFYHVREDMIFYIKALNNPKPQVILDEFGDLPMNVYLEFKALWNATDHYCSWYAMGADGLKYKIDRHISRKIIGFAEIFSRMGNKYQRITPVDDAGFNAFQKKQIAQVGKANGLTDIKSLHAKTNMSLRRIPIQIGLERKQEEDNKAETQE